MRAGKGEAAATDAARKLPLEDVPSPLEQPTEAPGVVFFERVTDELCELLVVLSARGARRVLAVAGEADAMDGDGQWRLLRAGAADVLAWDAHPDPRAQIEARVRHWHQVDDLVESALVVDNLVGTSPSWRQAVREVVELARFSDTPLLISGESGTGKELVARLVHALDGRQDKAELVVLDCTTVIPTLSGSEFFGHERGSFTGAASARAGAFELADGGTLFLDEVGELAADMQAELLRVIQEGTYKRVGSSRWKRTRFRLVCATNRDLAAEQRAGGFRPDLYYRIAAASIQLPPLRDRLDDVLPLARHFLHAGGEEPLEPDEVVQRYLASRTYPGNVRELAQVIERMRARHVGPGPLTVGDIPPGEWPEPEAEDTGLLVDRWEAAIREALDRKVRLKHMVADVRNSAIRIAVERAEGNHQRAAAALGVTDRRLQLWRAERERENGRRARAS